MKALVLKPNNKTVTLEDVIQPNLQGDDEIKLKVLEVGICGTDREEVSGAYSMHAAGKDSIVLGHEMLGQVVEVGAKVQGFNLGDLAVFTVRRGCGLCQACQRQAFDLCFSGNYLERGIKGLDGFQTEYVVDKAAYAVKLTADMRSFGVLCEPTSVVEKAIDVGISIQKSRQIPLWSDTQTPLAGKKTLVIGLGPIGLLAALILRLRGAQVWGSDVLDPKSTRVQLFEKIGGIYLNAKTNSSTQMHQQTGGVDMLIEAVGSAAVAMNLIPALGPNGVYVITGVTPEHQNFNVDGGALIRQMVLYNQAIVGSVNAGKRHWQQGVADLSSAEKQFAGFCSALITSRQPYTAYQQLFSGNAPNEIKQVIVWSK